MAGRVARVTVQVQPGATRSEVVRWQDGVLYLRVAAPPVRGRANDAVVKMVAEVLGVSRGNITIEKGATSRRKLLRIEGMTEEEVRGRVESLLP